MFDYDVEFIGVESEGSEKAMALALMEGVIGDADTLKNFFTKKKQRKRPGGWWDRVEGI